MYLGPFYFLFRTISSRQNHLICYLRLETQHTGEIVASSFGGFEAMSQRGKHDWSRKGIAEARH